MPGATAAKAKPKSHRTAEQQPKQGAQRPRSTPRQASPGRETRSAPVFQPAVARPIESSRPPAPSAATAAPAAAPAAGAALPEEKSASVADTRFDTFAAGVATTAAALAAHGPAPSKIAQAHAAAVQPSNERMSVAQSAKVTSTADAAVTRPERDSFLALLRAKLDEIAPKNLDELDKFKSSGKAGDMKGALTSQVSQQKDAASSDLRARASGTPDPSAVPARTAEPLPAEPPAHATPAVDVASATPAPTP